MVTEIGNYVEKIQERYPYLTKDEIKKILAYGLRQYAWVNKMHADVLICYKRDDPMVAHCGPLGSDSLKHYHRFIVKNRMRERVLYYLKKEKWDGYYYIGLTEEEQKNLKKGKIKTFKNVYLTKLKKELYHIPFVKHIWKVPMIDDLGWRFFREEFKTDQAEYIGENQYEKYHKCFLKRDEE